MDALAYTGAYSKIKPEFLGVVMASFPIYLFRQVLICGTVCVLLVISAGCSSNKSNSVLQSKEAITVEPKLVDFGRIHQSQKCEKVVKLTNHQSSAVVIGRIETSCPCLSLNMPRKVIAAGESIDGVLQIDSSLDPDFHGALRITVDGISKNGRKLFSFDCDIEIKQTLAASKPLNVEMGLSQGLLKVP